MGCHWDDHVLYWPVSLLLCSVISLFRHTTYKQYSHHTFGSWRLFLDYYVSVNRLWLFLSSLLYLGTVWESTRRAGHRSLLLINFICLYWYFSNSPGFSLQFRFHFPLPATMMSPLSSFVSLGGQAPCSILENFAPPNSTCAHFLYFSHKDIGFSNINTSSPPHPHSLISIPSRNGSGKYQRWH